MVSYETVECLVDWKLEKFWQENEVYEKIVDKRRGSLVGYIVRHIGLVHTLTNAIVQGKKLGVDNMIIKIGYREYAEVISVWRVTSNRSVYWQEEELFV